MVWRIPSDILSYEHIIKFINTDQIGDKGAAQQEHPQIQVDGVAEHGLMRIVEPAAGQRGPNALAQYLERL